MVQTKTYLQTKLVEEIVYKIFGTIHNPVVKVLPGNVMKDGTGGRRRKFVPQPEKLLVSVDCDLKGQDGQHQQVILVKKYRKQIHFILIWTLDKNIMIKVFYPIMDLKK